MGTVLQFAEQLSDNPGWTAAERAQLRDVGQQMAGVEVVFGTSELGDPWCVVTDDEGEVLLHAARIGGEFVVHSTADDAVIQGEDLWGAAKRLLGDMLKERRGTLLPFPPEILGQTAVLAFIFAAVLRGDFGAWRPAVEADAPADDAPPPAAHHGGDASPAHTQDRAAPSADQTSEQGAPIAVQEAAHAEPARTAAGPPAHEAPAQQQTETAPTDSAAPAPKAPAPPPPDRAGAGSGHGQTVPTSQNTEAAFTASGGGGAAPETERAVVTQGGAGDDRVAVSPGAVATGGAGADTFVLSPPATASSIAASAPAGPVLLGVIGDFHAAEGDKLELAGKGVVVVDRAEADVLAAVRGQFRVGETPVIAGRHIGYDTDGDGREDAYVLVTDTDWHGSGANGSAGGPIGIVGSAPASEPVL